MEQTMEKSKFGNLRKLAEFLREQESYRGELLENLLKFNWNSFHKLVESIDNNYLTIDEWLESDYISDDNYYYSSNDYVNTREGTIEPKESCNFCEYYSEYTTEEIYQCFINTRSYYYCNDAIEDVGLHEYNGSYYDNYALDRNDLCLIEGEVYRCDNCYFYNGEWNVEPEEEEEQFRRGYHNGGTRWMTFSDEPTHFIGFEIEKEDSKILESIEINDFENLHPKWRKEEDGSLDSDSGFELVSPAFELNVDRIADIVNDDVLKKHINAKYSERCGGHLNLSQKGLSGEEFFRTIEGYTPLIYALYPKRLKVDYCKGKSNKSLKDDRAKYQAINIREKHIEYRIFSAIPNVDTLIWRTKLMKVICDNPTSCVKQAFLNVNSVLRDVLYEQYSTPERFERLMQRVVRYTMNYEGINPKED